ncbi:MAG TPA: creatininase family protein [Candidatus Limnocylindrales bacterium]|nr:creatininase family protein [Candidatus Limnocylindrales bacterium]
MKPATVFLGEMTNPEVEAFLRDHDTVIIPVGATEQHGPHGPLGSDFLVPVEVARRIAPTIGAVVAPSINYGLSYPHVGFTGVVHVRISTFMTLIEDIAVSLATIGFRRLVFLNGHYDNKYPIAFACASAADRLPDGVRAFPINYWDGLAEDQTAEFLPLHANRPEASAVMALDPDLVDIDLANEEMPPFPETADFAALHAAFFYSSPGSVYRATHSGTWGDARGSSAEFGERCLDVYVEATIRLLDDIERANEAMPRR